MNIGRTQGKQNYLNETQSTMHNSERLHLIQKAIKSQKKVSDKASETSAQVSTKIKRDRSKSKYLNPAKVDCWRGHPDFKSPDHAKSTQ